MLFVCLWLLLEKNFEMVVISLFINFFLGYGFVFVVYLEVLL